MPQSARANEPSVEQLAYQVASGDRSALEDTLGGIAASARAALDADRASVYVVDVDTARVLDVYTTESDPRRQTYLRNSIGKEVDDIPIWRLHTSAPDPVLVISDLHNDPRVPPEVAAGLGSGAILGVRLEHPSVRIEGRPALLGTLFLSYPRPRSFPEHELQVARGLAALGTLALANARLQEETVASLRRAKSLASEQSALWRVAAKVAAERSTTSVFRQTANEVATLLDADLGLVARFDDGRAVPVGWHGVPIDQLYPLGRGGALAEVARTGRVARVRDYGAVAKMGGIGQVIDTHGYRSGVAAPVRVGGHLWGALLAATKADEPIDTEAEARLVRFAGLVSLAIGNAEAEDRLRAQAATDPLTGLANHGTFFERLDAEVRRARRREEPLSLMIIDVDHFKQVNDRFGHLVGDAVLVEIATRIGACARAEDVVARIGGEEFAWLMPDTDARAAWVAGDRVRATIAGTGFADAGPVTVSAGVEELRGDMTVTELFRRADHALYWAKDHGRDLCVRYAPEQERRLPASSHGGDVRHLGGGSAQFVELAHQQVGLTATFLAELVDGRLEVRHAAGDFSAFGIERGSVIAADDDAARSASLVAGAVFVRDVHLERRARGLPLVDVPELGAFVSVPVNLPQGLPYGVLVSISRHAEAGLGIRDVRALNIIAALLGEELERAVDAERVHRAKDQRVRQALEGAGRRIVFQPIVDLVSGAVTYVEALSRFDIGPAQRPDAWFADAASLGLGVALEIAAVRSALERLGEVPAGARLSVNASPATVLDPDFQRLIEGAGGGRIAVEITEHAPVDNSPRWSSALERLRRAGAHIVVDDAGAGFASFKHLIDTHPQVIKLDMTLTRDIDTDPLRRALAASLVAFAHEIDARIVAEGIETLPELDTLRELGIKWGQGYLLARPSDGRIAARVPVPRTGAASRAARSRGVVN